MLRAVVLTESGYGYTTPPVVTVPGHPELTLEARLAFGRDLEKNGSVAAVTKAGAAR